MSIVTVARGDGTAICFANASPRRRRRSCTLAKEAAKRGFFALAAAF